MVEALLLALSTQYRDVGRQRRAMHQPRHAAAPRLARARSASGCL